MLHEPSEPTGEDRALQYKTRLGAWMFLIYAVIYAGFVILNLASPILMEKEILFGLNLSVTYGFGLILFAFVLALIYNRMCSRKERELNGVSTPKKEN
jgi:uncharacterized membrane protein (DUF485 family)